MIMTYLRLMFEFAKTGLFAVGGGLATLPFLYEMAEKTGWFTKADILNLVAISESTPGAIGINMATYVGFLTGSAQGGWAFALCAQPGAADAGAACRALCKALGGKGGGSPEMAQGSLPAAEQELIVRTLDTLCTQ